MSEPLRASTTDGRPTPPWSALGLADFPALAVSALGLAGVFLVATAWLGVFRIGVALTVVILGAVALAGGALLWQKRASLSRRHAILLVLAVVGAILLALHPSHSVEAGRDNGFYRAMAVGLATTDGFVLDRSDAPTWIGYFESDAGARPEAALGYPALMGLGARVLGPDRVHLVNAVLMLLSSLVAAALVARVTGSTFAAGAAIVLLDMNYFTVWFVKDLFLENLQLTLLLTLAYVLVRGQSDLWIHSIAAFPAGYLLLTHSSGVLYVAVYVGLVALPFVRRLPGRALVAAAGATILVGALGAAFQYDKIRVNAVPIVNAIKSWADPGITTYAEVYPLLMGMALILSGVAALVVPAALAPRRRETALVAGFFLPGLLFLLLPVISPDWPWGLRHLWAAILPPLVLLACFGFPATGARRRMVYAAGLGSILLVQAVAIGPAYMIEEDKSTFSSWETLLEDVPAGSTLLLPSGRLGAHAPLLAHLFDLRALQPPKSFPWAPRFPADDHFEPQNYSQYVDRDMDRVYVVVENPVWLDSEFSSFFVLNDLRPVRSANLTFEKIAATCDVIFYLTSPENSTRVDPAYVFESCERLPRSTKAITSAVTLYEVVSHAGNAFLEANARMRASPHWEANETGIHVDRLGVLRMSSNNMTVEGWSLSGMQLKSPNGITQFTAGAFTACVPGGDIEFNGLLEVQRVRVGCS